MGETSEEKPFLQRNKRRILIAGLLITLLMTVYSGFVWYVYSVIAAVPGGYGDEVDNRPNRFNITWGDFKDTNVSEYWMGEYENVSINLTGEEITLDAWFIPGDPSQPAIIMVHGVTSSKASGHVLTVSGMLNNNGFNILIIDMRDHGLSTMEDGRHSAGVKEYRDVLAAFDWLQTKKEFASESIGLYGMSLGAGVVAVAFAEDTDVPCVAMSAPYSDMIAIAQEEADYHGMGYLKLTVKHALILVPLMGGDDLASKPPLIAVDNHAGRPMFIVHSKLDDRIGIHHTELFIKEANRQGANLTAWILEEGGHADEPFTHPIELEEKLVSFFGSCLSIT